MLTPYTTTITDEATRQDIPVSFIHQDPDWPIFDLHFPKRTVRCFNALTDLVGAATYHLVNQKRICHQWLLQHGFPVPDQCVADEDHKKEMVDFLGKHQPVVVKPCMQWGGRGVSMGIRTEEELTRAIHFARQYEPDVVMEETINGEDLRVILVGGELAAAISRIPAEVTGDGEQTLWQLIQTKNRERSDIDDSNLIPEDQETRSNLSELGVTPETILPKGTKQRVRLTNNYHTGGRVEIRTDQVPSSALNIAQQIVRALDLPLAGVDFLIDPHTGTPTVIEVSPDMAISPPEGETVAKAWITYLRKRFS